MDLWRLIGIHHHRLDPDIYARLPLLGCVRNDVSRENCMRILVVQAPEESCDN